MNWLDLVATVIHGFDVLVLIYFLLLNTTYLLLFLLSFGAVFRLMRRSFSSDYQQIMQSEMTWPISIVVAAHNEEKNIVDTVRSLLLVHYGEFEIVVVNDGSTDATLQRLVRAFDLTRVDRVYKRSIPTRKVRGVYGSLDHPKITVVDKVKGGRSDALNAGINVSRFPLFCSIDAGAIIEDNALLRAVKPFMERPEETVAASGVVRIANGCEMREGRVTRVELPDQGLPVLQVVEHLRAFITGRAGWSELRCMQIVSGAFGVYKKQEVIDVGGYNPRSESGELDLVVRLHRHLRERKRRYRVVFVPDPVCWTVAPSKIGELRRQRDRWHRGLAQTLWDNRGVIFNPRYGSLGLFSFPHAFLFEILGPFIEILGYAVVIASFLLGIVNLEFLLLFFTVAVLYGIFLSVAAVLLEEMSFRRYPGWLDLSKLIVFGIVENFGYRQMLSLFKIRALWEVIRRRPLGSRASDPVSRSPRRSEPPAGNPLAPARSTGAPRRFARR